MERDGRLYPIEVKLTSRPSRADTRGIVSFRKAASQLDIAPGLVLAPTDRFAKLSETEYALPWDSR